jgi:hypothetical protein
MSTSKKNLRLVIAHKCASCDAELYYYNKTDDKNFIYTVIASSFFYEFLLL